MTCWGDLKPGDVTIAEDGDAWMVIAIVPDAEGNSTNYIIATEMRIWKLSSHNYGSEIMSFTWRRDRAIDGVLLVRGSDA